MDSFFKYIDIPQEKQVRLVAFELNDTTFSWWQNIQNRRKVAGKQFICGGLECKG